MRRRFITLLVIVLIALLLALLFFFWQTGSGKVSHVYGLVRILSASINQHAVLSLALISILQLWSQLYSF